MSAEVRTLLWKELRQMPHKRGAMLSALLFPLLFLLVLPLANILGMQAGAFSTPTAGVNMPPGLKAFSDDPTVLARQLTLPLFIALGGLAIPSITASYTIIAERERGTVELLAALPVSLEQIVLAKLLAVLLLGMAVTLPFFVIDAAVVIWIGLAGIGDVVILLFLLLTALVYSTTSALLISLVARDFRTANNFNGATLGPIILLTMLALMLLPGGMLRVVALGLLFLVAAIVSALIAVRGLTIERFLG